MNSILIIILSFLILFIIQNIINNRTGINELISKNIGKEITSKFNNINSEQNELNKYIKKRSKRETRYQDPFYKFPDPMLSNTSNPLSPGFKPMFEQLNESNPDMSDLEIIRRSGMDYYIRDPKVFKPNFLPVDTMNANPGNFTLQGIANKYSSDESSILATSEEYLSQFPVYADSKFGNELTNTGYFFDNNDHNQYINLENKILPQNCSMVGDDLSCKLNGRLYPIPKELMKNSNPVLDSIGVLINNIPLVQSTDSYVIGDVDGYQYQIWNYPNESTMNGGIDFVNNDNNDVYASNPLGYNETFMNVTDNLNCSSCAI